MISECEDCVRAVRRLHGFLDRELSDEEVAEIEYHLQACPPCKAKFHFEDSVRKLVRIRGRNDAAPDSLRRRIAQMLNHSAPQTDVRSNA